MATPQRDLWPTTLGPPSGVNAPVTLLREQAALLATKTNDLVKAEVRTYTNESAQTVFRLGNRSVETKHGIMHTFYLVAPAMESYRYALFTVLQPVEMYPLVIADGPIEEFKADSEAQFAEGLRRVFASEKTQKIIQALIAQSLS